MSNSLEIAVDFDGTCVTHEFPKVGGDIGAAPILKKLVTAGHRLILFTMRDKNYLDDAVMWFTDNNIKLYAIQSNPSQMSWTTSPKCYSQLYIDDAALGIPLKKNVGGRPYVDWKAVEKLLEQKGLI